MSMETIEKRVYLCEDATDSEISIAIRRVVFGSSYSAAKLRYITCPVSGTETPWDTAAYLVILGSGYLDSNAALKEAVMKPGMYTSHRGNWLILVYPEAEDIQKAVDRCGGRLVSLEVFNTSIPELDVSACPRLEKLWVWNDERLLRIPGLEQLEGLTTLELSECSSLTELPSLERLERLTYLNLFECSGLRELPGLERLEGLTELYLSGWSGLTELPGLERLEELTTLSLSGCSGLTELPGLERLERLTKLDLSGCSGLRELPGLERLERLTFLNLSGCSGLTDLPEGIRQLKSLRWLYLDGMKLKTLPDWLPEIAEGFEIRYSWIGTGKQKANVSLLRTTVENMEDMSIFSQPYEVVAEWFKNRSLGRTRTLNEIKVVFLGDGEAGKSHTIARLMGDGGDPVDYTDMSTPGIVIKHKPYTHDGRDFRVHYWDFGGQEIMHSMHRIFLTNRTMYVVLLNARDDTQGDRAHYWLQNIQSFAPDAPVLLVLNKIDQNPKASVDERTLRAKYPGLRQIVRMSALEFSQEQFNREFRDVLLEEIANTGCLDAQWPGSWIRVKERLEKMESHFILGDEYKRICAECELKDVELSMLKYFNELGVSFCFCDEDDYELEDHVILRPDWITNGLYIILFNQLADAKNGLIPHKSIYKLLRSAHCNPDIRCTLPNARYDSSDIHYVLGVMRKFDLSFTDGKDNEFIPMLCQQNSTVNVQYYRRDSEVLEFNMEFDYLPSNLLHRLMVERHSELDMDNVWRTGARFHHRELGYSAVVVIDGNTLRFFIRHADPMHRPNTYLTMLKSNVDRIVEKMGLKAPACKLVYKLEGRRDEFDYEMLKAMLDAGQSQAFSMTWRRMFPIQGILNQSAPDGLQDEMQLLDAIRRSCNHLQDERCYRLDPNASNRDKEDLRNRRIRDDLETLGYRVSDQTQRGGGELDLRILDDSRKPWTIIEALRISNGKKREWNEHLNKLVGRYNTNGLPVLYLLTYVDADPAGFDQIWTDYQSHIPAKDTESYACVRDSRVDLNSNGHRYVQTAKYRYACGSLTTTVYHIFARIPLHGE